MVISFSLIDSFLCSLEELPRYEVDKFDSLVCFINTITLPSILMDNKYYIGIVSDNSSNGFHESCQSFLITLENYLYSGKPPALLNLYILTKSPINILPRRI